jgi:hypothetical protein
MHVIRGNNVTTGPVDCTISREIDSAVAALKTTRRVGHELNAEGIRRAKSGFRTARA